MAKQKTTQKPAGRKKAIKRELIDTGTDKRYVRRGTAGKFKESDDEGKSLTADRRKKAKTKVKSGQGDKGDRQVFVFFTSRTWNSTADDVERPNRIVWDLDPGPQVGWKQVAAAAKVVRDVLKTLGLVSWVKTTGGHGLHVVAPIKPQRAWSECLEFARGVSEAIEQTDPIYTRARGEKARPRLANVVALTTLRAMPAAVPAGS